MKAMIVKEQCSIEDSPLELVNQPKPKPDKGQLLVKVKVCGICRTDLHIAEGDLPIKKSGIIPGHQIVGEVAEVGPSVKKYKEGDRIGISWLNEACGRCHYCKQKKENLCEFSKHTGWNINGGFAEYCVVPEDFAYSLPNGFSDEEAAPLLCGGIMGYRALKRTEIQPGQRLGFFGFGAAAHIALQIAKFWRCEIYVVTRSPQHQRMALEMGAYWVGDTGNKFPTKLDAAIIFGPEGKLIPVAMENLDRGGTLVLSGIHVSEIPQLKYQDHLFHEKTIRTVTSNTRADGVELLDLADLIPLRPQVQVFDFADANKALETLKNKGIQGGGVLRISE